MTKKLTVLLLSTIAIGSTISFQSTYIMDVANHWAKDTINKFVKQGYVQAYEDDTFKPDKTITRAEFIDILNKYFNLTKTSDKSYEDTKNHWSKQAVDIAITNGVLSKSTGKNFNPDSAITREDAWTMIANHLKIKDTKIDKLNQYKDANKISKEVKPQVEAMIEKNYVFGADDKINPKAKMTRAEAVITLDRINNK